MFRFFKRSIILSTFNLIICLILSSTLFMNKKIFLFIILITSCLMSCGILEDTDVDPIYYLECEIDGNHFRAQTNDEAFMSTSLHNPDTYVVTGQDIAKDFQVNLDLFMQLGEGKILVATNVNNLLTSISLFMGGKSYNAILSGGEGCVVVQSLSETDCEGTFEGIVIERDNENDKKVITNGRFKVKTKN